MSRSFILQFIRSLAFVWWEWKAQAHIAFHDLLCRRSTQTNRWEPSLWTRLTKLEASSLISQSCLHVSPLLMSVLMNIQWRCVLCYLWLPRLSSPLKLRGLFYWALTKQGTFSPLCCKFLMSRACFYRYLVATLSTEYKCYCYLEESAVKESSSLPPRANLI